MAIFTNFACFFNSALKEHSLENEERSLHQTWSVFYWSSKSMFGWVLSNSKIWPKMAILPHPRYGDFYRFCLFFNSALSSAVSWERREISSPNLVSVLLKSHVNVWLSFKQIQNLTENGDFAPTAVWRFFPFLPVFQLRQYHMLSYPSEQRKISSPNLVSVLLKPPCKCLVEF